MLLHFSHDYSNWSFPSFSSTTFQKFPGVSDLLPEASRFQHHIKLCSKRSTSLASYSSFVQFVRNLIAGVVDPFSELDGIWFVCGSIKKSNYEVHSDVTRHKKLQGFTLQLASGRNKRCLCEALHYWQVRTYRVKVCAPWPSHTWEYSDFCLRAVWRRVCQPHLS